MPIGFVWQTFLETPLVNFMVILTIVSFGSYGVAILLFTVVTRLVTFPLTMRTMRSTKAMQAIQPQLEEIKKKYSDPRRRSEETMKLYKTSGVNPLGCLGTQLLQFPIFIALYQVIRITIAPTPEGVLRLDSRLYEPQFLHDAIPLSTRFLFLDLGANGSLVLVAIVFAAMWLQQRIATTRNVAATDQQRQMNQMMQWMMPAMFAWFVIVVPAGLGLYWAATTVIGIILHWVFIGPGDFTWGSLVPDQVRARLAPATAGFRDSTTHAAALPAVEGDPAETRTEDDDGSSSGNQRNRRRGGNRPRPRSARSQSRSGRRRRRSRR